MKSQHLMAGGLVLAGLFMLSRRQGGLNGLGAGPTPAVSAHLEKLKLLEAAVKNQASKVAELTKAANVRLVSGTGVLRNHRGSASSSPQGRAKAAAAAALPEAQLRLNELQAQLAPLKAITVYTDQHGNAYMPDEYQALMNQPTPVENKPATPPQEPVKMVSPGGVAPLQPPGKNISAEETAAWANILRNTPLAPSVQPAAVSPAPAQIIHTPAPSVVVHQQPTPSAAAVAQPQSGTSSLKPLLMIGTVAAVPLVMGLLGD